MCDSICILIIDLHTCDPGFILATDLHTCVIPFLFWLWVFTCVIPICILVVDIYVCDPIYILPMYIHMCVIPMDIYTCVIPFSSCLWIFTPVIPNFHPGQRKWFSYICTCPAAQAGIKHLHVGMCMDRGNCIFLGTAEHGCALALCRRHSPTCVLAPARGSTRRKGKKWKMDL